MTKFLTFGNFKCIYEYIDSQRRDNDQQYGQTGLRAKKLGTNLGCKKIVKKFVAQKKHF